MAKKFESFFIDHVLRQQNAHADALASLAASLSLPIGAEERAFVYSRDLYCCKFALEDSKTPRGDLQVKEILETSTSHEPRNWWFPYIDFVLYGILPDDPKEAAIIRRKVLLQCNHANIISPVVWWNLTPTPFTQRDIGGTQRSSWPHMWS